MSVALDTLGTKGTTNGTPATSLNCTGTVGAGSNRALIVPICFDLNTPTGITVTWDPTGANQALTLITTQNSTGGQGKTQIWGLINPTTGSGKTVHAAWTTSSDACLNAVSYTGVDQTGGTTSFIAATPTSGGSGVPTITVASAVGNAVMDCEYAYFATGYTQTLVFTDSTFTNYSGGSSRAAGAASVVFAWTTAGTPWIEVGVNIVAASSAVYTLTAVVGAFAETGDAANLVYVSNSPAVKLRYRSVA